MKWDCGRTSLLCGWWWWVSGGCEMLWVGRLGFRWREKGQDGTHRERARLALQAGKRAIGAKGGEEPEGHRGGGQREEKHVHPAGG